MGDGASAAGSDGSRRVRRRTAGLPVRAAAALQERMGALRAERLEADIDWIAGFLRQHPDQVINTRVFLESGLEAKAQDQFPRGVRRLVHIPIRDKAKALANWAGITEELLRTVYDADKNIEMLFYWVLGLPKQYPVVNRNKTEFFSSLLGQYSNNGSLLSTISFNAAGTRLDWTFNDGCYKLVRCEGGMVDSVVCNRTRQKAQLPKIISEQLLATFDIEDNYSNDQAKLTGEFDRGISSSIKLATLFLTAVPPEVPKATAGAMVEETTVEDLQDAAAKDAEPEAPLGSGAAEDLEEPPA